MILLDCKSICLLAKTNRSCKKKKTYLRCYTATPSTMTTSNCQQATTNMHLHQTNHKDLGPKGNQNGKNVSQHALLREREARLSGALSKGGKMHGVATNVYLWKTSGKPKETGQNENSKFGSCIYV